MIWITQDPGCSTRIYFDSNKKLNKHIFLEKFDVHYQLNVIGYLNIYDMTKTREIFLYREFIHIST